MPFFSSLYPSSLISSQVFQHCFQSNIPTNRWSGLSNVAGCQRKSQPTWLVLIGLLLCVAFLYGCRLLHKISLDWPLTLTTQSSTSKLSDNPDGILLASSKYGKRQLVMKYSPEEWSQSETAKYFE